MRRKRQIPKAWMTLRQCCGVAPTVTYEPDLDGTTIQCRECGAYVTDGYEEEAVQHWNEQSEGYLGNVDDDELKECPQCNGPLYDGTEKLYVVDGEQVWLHARCNVRRLQLLRNPKAYDTLCVVK